MGWLRDFPQDLRQAIRTLQHSLSFALVAISTLALGIGANTAVFTVADSLLLRPPPFDRSDDLYWIYDVNEKLRFTVDDLTPPSIDIGSPET
jgi:putative ABC transport system permease protein